MFKKYAQAINTVLIFVGGAILLYTISGEGESKYLQILGLIIIMFGLYRATNYWVETKDDHQEDAQNDIEEESNSENQK
ncbi:MAG TPA: hypothetical protein VFD29_04380 [Gillisia sp.]|nr:hypothetical protein [Gillisia sp.]